MQFDLNQYYMNTSHLDDLERNLFVMSACAPLCCAMVAKALKLMDGPCHTAALAR